MKKILFTLIVLAGILSSCSNDDIEIGKPITFKVNPKTVVTDLNPSFVDELTTLDDESKLTVTVYIYNEKGALVKCDSTHFPDYSHVWSTDLYLPDGTYTALATSHVSSDTYYWIFSGTNQLSTFKITDNGYIGGEDKLLGLNVMTFTVDGTSSQYSMDLKIAGCVSYVSIRNLGNYSDKDNVKYFSLRAAQTCDYLTFDNFGQYSSSISTHDGYDIYSMLFSYDPEDTGFGNYFFTFPMENAYYRFFAEKELYDGDPTPLGYGMKGDMVQGRCYWFDYDCSTNEANWYLLKEKSSMPKMLAPVKENLLKNASSRIKYNYAEKSISIR